jgi:hypothetical protein
MPKNRKDPYRPRPCRLCKLIFKPAGKNPKNADEQEFCCAAHRKEFWKHGALPFRKLLLRMEKRMREIAREEIKAAVIEPIEEQIFDKQKMAEEQRRRGMREIRVEKLTTGIGLGDSLPKL